MALVAQCIFYLASLVISHLNKIIQWLSSALGLKSKPVNSLRSPTCLSYLLPYHSLCFSYARLLSVPQACQALSYPWTFALAVPSAWNTLCHLPHGSLAQPGYSFLKDAFLTSPSKDTISGPCLVILYHTPLLLSFTGLIISCNYPVISLFICWLSPF